MSDFVKSGQRECGDGSDGSEWPSLEKHARKSDMVEKCCTALWESPSVSQTPRRPEGSLQPAVLTLNS